VFFELSFESRGLEIIEAPTIKSLCKGIKDYVRTETSEVGIYFKPKITLLAPRFLRRNPGRRI
jgi:hypothetical protein